MGYVDRRWHKKELILLFEAIIEEYGIELFKD